MTYQDKLRNMMSFPLLQGLFAKPKGREGWLAARIRSDELMLAHVVRYAQGRPLVTLCATFPWGEFEAAGHFDRYRTSYLLNAGEYQLLSPDAPAVPKAELKQAVRWKVKDMIDYRVEEATLDVLEIPGEHEGKGRSLIVVAAKNEIIRDKMRSLSEKGISLSAIDIPEAAQRNIASLMEEAGKGIAMLSMDEEGGLFTISCRGELYFARRIDADLGQLPNESEEGKRQMERIALELQRSLDYFDRQFHSVALSGLILAPRPGADELLNYLAANLYLTVKMADLNELFEFHEPLSMDQQARFFLLVGGALRVEPS